MQVGAGLLAIWNDILPGKEAAFRAWHSGEHLAERLSVPGFLRGRRLFATDARPRWLTLYLTQAPAVLSSAAYLARLNAPSPATLATLPSFTGTERMASEVLWSGGRGRGGVVASIRPTAALSAGELRHAAAGALGADVALAASVVQSLPAAPQQTIERSLRHDERRPPDLAVFLELSDSETAARLGEWFGAGARIDVYQLEHEMTPPDIEG